ncbi:MAG: disulfide bond formation protein B [Devosiaceae bacterium]|nr:disulfide bond formation protein B [Devosiaceae bacterium]
MAHISTNNFNLANAAFMVGFFTIVGAWGFELIGGYIPCELCLAQRLPYYLGLPILAATVVLWQSIPSFVRLMLTLLVGVIFLWSIYLGAFHSGVEWKFWPGPTACSGTGTSLSFTDLSNLSDASIVPCDEPEFRFLGIIFAGYNALISSLIVLLLTRSSWGQFKALRAKKAS